MNITPLRELHDARPFVPFSITLADGRKLEVIHNEFLSLFPSGHYAIVFQSDDRFTLVDMQLVTSVDVDPLHGTRRPKATAKKK